jgi:hypothetical protein
MIIATQQQEFSWNSKYEMETPPCVYSAFAQKKFLSLCMTLAVDSAEFNDDSASVTYDPGNTGPEERRFDAWEPS